MNSLISVIVPVYKSEKYFERCVKSILSQSYSNLEVLLIDDGSPDRCPAMCDTFEALDERVKVFHKANGGASSARNIGIENAKGDYICFVDSDDVLPENSILDLWKGITKENCQYAAGICGILGSSKVKNGISEGKVIDYAKNPLDLLHYITQCGSYAPHSKIYDAGIIRGHGLRFDENLKCSEDTLFIRQYLSYCTRIALLPVVVYRYNTRNKESLSKKFYPDFCFYYAIKMEALEVLVQKLPIPEEDKRNFIFDRAVHGLYISIHRYLMNCNKKEQKLFLIGEAIKTLKKWTKADGEAISHKEWWSKYANAVQNDDVESIYRAFGKEIRKEKTVQKLKDFIKKIIRG